MSKNNQTENKGSIYGPPEFSRPASLRKYEAKGRVSCACINARVPIMGTGLAALVFRARRRLTLLEPSSGAMLLIYLVGLALVYASTR